MMSPKISFCNKADRDFVILCIEKTEIKAIETPSEIILQAKMHTSCFYPFIQYYLEDELAMSYTVARKHIRLARFALSKYIE